MEKRNTISVVLTTYNGARFIEEQLLSIIQQTRIPDEIIVLDDCSTDNTINIVNNLIDEYKDINFRLVQNENNKGWKINFIHGFHEALGDIIFCADQDDIWDKYKIEIMAKYMNENVNINVLACNLIPLYETGAVKLADFYIKNCGTNYLERVDIENQGLNVIRPGCTMCFRRTILSWIDSIWCEKLAHDEVIWAIGVATKSAYIVNEPLIYFRRHGLNNSPNNEKKISSRLERAECNSAKIQQLLKNDKVLKLDIKTIKNLQLLYDFTKDRIKTLYEKDFWRGVKLFRYIRMYSSIRSWIVDLICILRQE